GRDTDPQRDPPLLQHGPTSELVMSAEDPFHEGEDRPAERRELELLRRPVKQARAELFFELGDGLGQRGLRDRTQFGRPSERAGLGQGPGITQLIEVHPTAPRPPTSQSVRRILGAPDQTRWRRCGEHRPEMLHHYEYTASRASIGQAGEGLLPVTGRAFPMSATALAPVDPVAGFQPTSHRRHQCIPIGYPGYSPKILPLSDYDPYGGNQVNPQTSGRNLSPSSRIGMRDYASPEVLESELLLTTSGENWPSVAPTGTGRRRLSRADWVEAATEELAAHGFPALAATSAAQRLGVPEKSFATHFESHDDLVEAVLQRWKALDTDELVE